MALGNSDRAVQLTEVGLGFTVHFAKAPVTTVQLSRYACIQLLLESFQDMLSSTALTEAQLIRLDQALLRTYDPAVLARTWIGERRSTARRIPSNHAKPSIYSKREVVRNCLQPVPRSLWSDIGWPRVSYPLR
jgi:hypothetical protein